MAAKSLRPIRIEGNVAYIPLTKHFEAIIDTADVPLVDDRNWCAAVRPNGTYAVSKGRCDGKMIGVHLHRVILSAPAGMQADHIDGDGLNNRRSNLRLATPSENARNQRRSRDNTSGFKGVWWHKGRRKWQAQIMAGGRQQYLGLFNTAEAAHAAYCEAAKSLHGEFARAG